MSQKAKSIVRTLSSLGRKESVSSTSIPTTTSTSTPRKPSIEPSPPRVLLPIQISETERESFNIVEFNTLVEGFAIYENGIVNTSESFRELLEAQANSRKFEEKANKVLSKMGEEISVKIPTVVTFPKALQSSYECLNYCREYQAISKRAIQGETIDPLEKFIQRDLKYSREELTRMQTITKEILSLEKKSKLDSKQELQLNNMYLERTEMASKMSRNLHESKREGSFLMLKGLSAYLEAKKIEHERCLQEINKLTPLIKSAIESIQEEKNRFDNLNKVSSSSEPPVFGVAVDILFQREGEKVPKFLVNLINHLEKNGQDAIGLFRRGAEDKQEEEVTFDLIKRGKAVDWSALTDIHVGAAILKQFFQQMPDPLLTYELYQHWLDIVRNYPQGSMDELRIPLENVLGALPSANRAVLQFLIQFLANFSEHSKKHQMTVENLSIVFGPCLIFNYAPTHDEVTLANRVIEYLIEGTRKFGAEWINSATKSTISVTFQKRKMSDPEFTTHSSEHNTLQFNSLRNTRKVAPERRQRGYSVVGMFAQTKSIFGKGPKAMSESPTKSEVSVVHNNRPSPVRASADTSGRGTSRVRPDVNSGNATGAGPTATSGYSSNEVSPTHSKSPSLSNIDPTSEVQNHNALPHLGAQNHSKKPSENNTEQQLPARPTNSKNGFSSLEGKTQEGEQYQVSISSNAEVVHAKHKFVGQSQSEISFDKGAVIYVSERHESGWWVGQLAETGAIGWFPSTFVDTTQTK